MERIASLLKSARELRRSLWASLPRGYRLVHAYFELTADITADWGKLLYAVFIQQGVTGMPNINGMPVEEWVKTVPGGTGNLTNILRRLPQGYGREFGRKIQKLAIVILKRMDLVEDTIQLWMVQVTRGVLKINPNTTLHVAENYALKSVKNASLNAVKAMSRDTGRYDSLTTDEEGQIDISDTTTMRELEEAFPDWRSPDVLEDLREVAPWAPTYLDLLVEGYNDDEIFGFSKLTPNSGDQPSVLAERMHKPFVPRPGTTQALNRGIWSKPGEGVKNKILNVLREHLT